jgi:predicted component of type VI protein secretion system
VCINSSKNRLERGRPYAIKSGDRILIDPYEIRASITRDQKDRSEPAAGAPLAGHASAARYDASSPFDADDPFAPRPNAASGIESPGEERASQELDPLELLDLVSKRPPPSATRPRPRISMAARCSKGTTARRASCPRRRSDRRRTRSIPRDYDPLAPEDNYDLLKRSRCGRLRRHRRSTGARQAARPGRSEPRRRRRFRLPAPPVGRSIPADIPPPRYEPAPDV